MPWCVPPWGATLGEAPVCIASTSEVSRRALCATSMPLLTDTIPSETAKRRTYPPVWVRRERRE
jgi:hypothetical protein